MSTHKLLIELTQPGLINTELIGNKESVISLVLDVMENNLDMRYIVLKAASIHLEWESEESNNNQKHETK